jgi:N-acetylmuramoyl-L-alanine amidase
LPLCVADGTTGRRRVLSAAAALLTLTACREPGLTAVQVRPDATQPPVSAAPPPPAAPAPGAPAGKGVVVSPAGVVVPVVADAADGRVVRTPCGEERTITGGTHVAQATIVLDAGHGGAEPGAVSPGGLAEAPVNLDVVRQARSALEREGVSVVETRTGDYQVNLATRAEIARNLGPRAFVSVHHNAEPDGRRDGPGTETYYQIGSDESKRLAGLIYEEVARALAAYRVTWVADTDAGAKYRPGQRGDYYAVLRLPAPVTSVLTELAFISNPSEAELLSRADVRAVEGEAVARGILRWLRTDDPGSGFTTPYPRVDPPGGPGGPGRCTDPPL